MQTRTHQRFPAGALFRFLQASWAMKGWRSLEVGCYFHLGRAKLAYVLD